MQETNKSSLKYGFFLFGGYSTKSEEAHGDLWLLKPDCEANKDLIL